MDKRIIIVIIAAAIIAVAAASVILLTGSSNEEDHRSASFEDTRLRIYGNANGDDCIDKTDLGIVNWIVSSNTDSDKANDVDWKNKYPLADANYDGAVDSNDATSLRRS